MSGNGGDSKPCSKSNSREQDCVLLEPLHYLLQVPGKSIRTKLMIAFNHWMQIPEEKLVKIGEIVQLLHHSSLLVDDIEDNSVLRRGIPVAHKIFGVPCTINCANYVLFVGLERVLDLGHPQAVQIFSEQMLELHRGQGMELHWRENMICPSEEDYRLMTVRKTGGLFNLGVRLMQIFSTLKDDYIGLTSLLGLYFQIRDDYANLSMAEYAENKSFAEDLTEGKFSFPIIHGISQNKEDTQLMQILRQRTTDIEVKKYCIKLLESKGSLEYTKSVLHELDARARAEVDRLGGNELLISVLDELKNWA